jgi:hypothetical protein
MTAATLAGQVRAAAADSVLARLLIRVSAAFEPGSAVRVHVSAWESETAWLRDDVSKTRMGRTTAALARAVARAWAGSSARREFASAADAVGGTTLPERVRAIGIWAATAAVADAVLTPFDPRPASVSRWTLWAGLFVLGATAAIFAGPVASAWAEWRARRLR